MYARSGGLQITVEVNIAIASNTHSVAGFFARDSATGILYLMHDGGVGGGVKGVGRSAFLAWSGAQLVPTTDSSGRGRPGLIVAPLIQDKVDSAIHVSSPELLHSSKPCAPARYLPGLPLGN